MRVITNIAGLGSLPQVIRATDDPALARSAPATEVREDTVEFSPESAALARAAASSSFRIARIHAVRADIAQGVYETPERVSVTAHRLLDVIG